MGESKLIGASIYEGDNTTKCRLDRLYCKLNGNCPLLAKNECIHRQMFGHCLYGRLTRVRGYTTRAYKSRPEWMAKHKKMIKDAPRMPGYPSKRLTEIGDYYWVPYDHINHYKGPQKWVEYSRPMHFGEPFIEKENLTPELVVQLAKMEPRALMGRVIPSYQEESVPAFLHDLKNMLPELYRSAAELDETILAKTPDYTKFMNKTVPIGKVSPGTRVKAGKYEGLWDGETLTIAGAEEGGILSIFQIGFPCVDAKVTVTPKPGNDVRVLDEKEVKRLFKAGAYSGR